MIEDNLENFIDDYNVLFELVKFKNLDKNLNNEKNLAKFVNKFRLRGFENSTILEVINNIKTYEINPQELGLKLSKIDRLIGGDPKQNAEKIIQLLDGERGPYRDIVILNSAAALYVDDKVKNIKDGIDLSIHSIDKGLAKSALEKLKKVSNS